MMTVAARMMIAMAIIAVGSHLLKMEIRKKSVCRATLLRWQTYGRGLVGWRDRVLDAVSPNGTAGRRWGLTALQNTWKACLSVRQGGGHLLGEPTTGLVTHVLLWQEVVVVVRPDQEFHTHIGGHENLLHSIVFYGKISIFCEITIVTD